MTYCLAWKKNGIAFLVADSAISAFKNEVDVDLSTFGEIQGLYNKSFVSDSALKLVQLSETCLGTYSGNVERALEALNIIKNSIDYFDIEHCFDIVNNSIDSLNKDDFELIILNYNNSENKIYYFGKEKFREVNNFIEIGSGKKIPYISDEFKKLINESDELPNDSFSHLAGSISYLQCSSIKNKFFNYGVGGAFFGVYLNKIITWSKDISYCILDEKFNSHFISILSRYESVYTASTYGDRRRYYFSQGSDIDVHKNLYIQKKIIKSLDTLIPEFLVFFIPEKNCIHFTQIDRWSHNSKFSYWIKRGNAETKYAFIFNKLHKLTMLSYKCDNFHPDFYNIALENTDFVPREDYYSIADKIENMPFDDEIFDNDLRSFKCNFAKTLYEKLHKNIATHKNIIVVDYEFFCQILREKFNILSNYGFTIKDFKLNTLNKYYMEWIASKEFSDYGVYFLKKTDQTFIIDNIEIDSLIKSFENCHLIDIKSKNFESEYVGFAFELLKNYYHNENYFHIDKIVFCADFNELNQVLRIVPQFNTESDKPDIILIRNMNRLTQMDGRFRYIVIDYLIILMFGASYEEIGFYI